MLVIAIKVKGLEGLPQKLRKLRLGVIARVAIMLDRAGQEVLTRSTEDYLSGPRPKKLGRVTGQLAQSVNYVVRGNRGVIGSTLPYARIHEQGGVIVPKKAKWLVFKTADGWRTAMKVTIPARPFLAPALKDARPAVLSIIRRLTNEAIAEAMA